MSGAVDGNVGSGFGQRDSNTRTQPSRGARNQRDLALEIEFFEYQGNCPFQLGKSIWEFWNP
jgi:hypothetical protein